LFVNESWCEGDENKVFCVLALCLSSGGTKSYQAHSEAFMFMHTSEPMLTVKVARRSRETDRVISLELVNLTGEPLPFFEAGAHVEVNVRPGVIRHYSLCNDPRNHDRYVLGILRETASRGGSETIHNEFDVGTTFNISPPRNNFSLDDSAGHSILFGGGIGITPLIAMAWHLHAKGASFEMHYCARDQMSAAFYDQLMRTPFAAHVTGHFDEGKPSQFCNFAAVLDARASDRHVYVCGPAGFMDAVVNTAKSQGWAGDNIHVEHFGAQIDTTGTGFTVHTKKTNLSLQVPSDKTIAEVLIAAGVSVPMSCEQGVCGTCLTTVLEGSPDHRDLFLTDAEKANGDQMTLCCSRSHSRELVLDI
jgi:vanillate O-demethylase ferredoxin subunit